MDLYHVWCDLKPGRSDTQFAAHVDQYLGELVRGGRIAGFRITRRKLGFGPRELGEFHIVIEVADLAQLEGAFHDVSTRSDPIESFHAAVNQSVTGLTFARDRDFPDAHRVRGEEKF